MTFILETDRLRLREMSHNDARHLYELNLDPDVLRFTGDIPFANVQEAETFIGDYDQYKKHGFGRWVVSDKNSGDFLGWCGLKFTPSKNEHDLGFRFFKRHWNKGYATESGNVCLNAGFEKFGLEMIVGRAMIENHASIRVLNKTGMKYWKEDTCGGQNGVVYRRLNTG